MRQFTLMRTKATTADDVNPNTTEPPASEIFSVKASNKIIFSFRKTGGGGTVAATATVWEKVTNPGGQLTGWISYATASISNGPTYVLSDVGPGSDLWIALTTNSGPFPVEIYVREV